MRTSQVANYAVRANWGQMLSEASTQTSERTISRSAAVLATLGIALSSFSLKQMVNKSPAPRR